MIKQGPQKCRKTLISKQLICLFLLVSLTAIAQNGKSQAIIKGRVLDESTLLPLVKATVAIQAQIKDSIVQSVLTDSNGMFSIISQVNQQKTRLEISFIGYINQTLDIHFTDSFYTIRLQPSPNLLQNVTVTATSGALSYGIDKKIYYPDKDLTAQSGSLSDVLQNIPSVSVDIDGSVTLRNSAVTFFINGRPSALFRGNVAAVLQQIPANLIERIEIITNPSAKYRPDGVGGIINIIMKKDTSPGFGGQLLLNAGSEERYNANLTLNYGRKKVTLSGGYSFRHANAGRRYDDERTFKDSASAAITGYYKESGESRNKSNIHTLYGNAIWKLSSHNNIELSGNMSLESSLQRSGSAITGYNPLFLPDYNFTNAGTNEASDKEAEIALQYEHLFKNKEDHAVSLEMTQGYFKEKENGLFDQLYSLPPGLKESRSIGIEKKGRQNELLLDYTLPLGEDGVLESGYAGEFIREEIDYNVNSANRFVLDQQIHAIYGLYGHSFEQFNFKAGIRVEKTILKPQLKLPVESASRNQYVKAFPTLHLGYKVSDHHNVSLSYSKRINRPDADELNPFAEYSDPRNAEAGNPFLLPEQTHSVELGHLYNAGQLNITNTFYYRYVYDAFTSIRKNVNDTVVLTTIQNLSNQKNMGWETVTSWQNKKWSIDVTGNVFHTKLNAAGLKYADKNSAITGNIKTNISFRPHSTTAFQVNGFYYFPSITPQGKRQAFFYLNAGARQQFFKGKFALAFTATDIFYTNKIRNTIVSYDLEQQTFRRRRGAIFYLGLRWKFRNFKKEEKLMFEQEMAK